MGETLAPSVRGQLRPLLGAVLVVTGVVANSAVFAVSLLVSRLFRPVVPLENLPIALTMAFFVALEFIWIRNERMRPWAVHTQVPQWWGHRHGPWLAAVRYGLRLGFGPATILNSWLWWGALTVTLTKPVQCALGLLTFVVVRTLTMLSVSWRVTSGPEMAQRAHLLDAVSLRVRLASVGLVSVASLVSVAVH